MRAEAQLGAASWFLERLSFAKFLTVYLYLDTRSRLGAAKEKEMEG